MRDGEVTAVAKVRVVRALALTIRDYIRAGIISPATSRFVTPLIDSTSYGSYLEFFVIERLLLRIFYIMRV